MEIIHVSAECYPVAKAGGLGDVVGALPKYQNQLGHAAKVVMPMYRTKFLYENEWETVHESGTYLGSQWFRYAIIKEVTNKLGFDLYLVDINGLLDREQVYGYSDDTERFLAFEIAVIHWINQWQHLPDVIHCHDHHTALIPFMLKYCYGIDRLRNIRTTLTIHNGQYQGWMAWDKMGLIPAFDTWKTGLIDWNHMINPLASGVRCADAVTTVSTSYLEELRYSANGLEKLFEYERGKCAGILNGIDNDVWDPSTDKYLEHHFSVNDVDEGKAANKKWLCERFKLEQDKPLIIFIGRLVGEKAAEILPQAISESIGRYRGNVNFLILGSGETSVESQLQNMVPSLKGKFNCYIGYNEELAHRMYAGADFLLMPSRVEPCGLNQMYALRYGTVPMVRKTGGLKDTVTDIGAPDGEGFGICFDDATAADVTYSVGRAVGWYTEAKEILSGARKKMMQIDHSWESSAQAYVNVYGVMENDESVLKNDILNKNEEPVKDDEQELRNEEPLMSEEPPLRSEVAIEDEKPALESQVPWIDEEPLLRSEVPIEDEEPALESQVPLIDEEPLLRSEVPIEDEKPALESQVPLIDEEPLLRSEVPIEDEEPALEIQVPLIDEEPPLRSEVPIEDGEPSVKIETSFAATEDEILVEEEAAQGNITEPGTLSRKKAKKRKK